MSHPARYLHTSSRVSGHFQSGFKIEMNSFCTGSRSDRTKSIFYNPADPLFTKPKQFVYSSRVFLAKLSLSLVLKSLKVGSTKAVKVMNFTKVWRYYEGLINQFKKLLKLSFKKSFFFSSILSWVFFALKRNCSCAKLQIICSTIFEYHHFYAN